MRGETRFWEHLTTYRTDIRLVQKLSKLNILHLFDFEL